MCFYVNAHSMLINQKYKDSPSSSALNSLRYAQKVIDLRLSHLQNNKNGWNNF